MEGMEQMKQSKEKEKEKAGHPVNSSEQEEADMVKAGTSETMEPADESQGNSKGLKLWENHKVLTKTISYVLHNTQLTFSNLHLSRMVKQELKGT